MLRGVDALSAGGTEQRIGAGHHRAFLRQDAVAKAGRLAFLLLLAAAIDRVDTQQRHHQAAAGQQQRVGQQAVKERRLLHRCGLSQHRRRRLGRRGRCRRGNRGSGLRRRSGGSGRRWRRFRGIHLRRLGSHHVRCGGFGLGRRGRLFLFLAGQRRLVGLAQLGDLGVLQLEQLLHVADILFQLRQARLGFLDLALARDVGFGLGARIGLRAPLGLAQLQLVARAIGRGRLFLHARRHVAGLLAAAVGHDRLGRGGTRQAAAIGVEALRARDHFAARLLPRNGLRLLLGRHLQHRAAAQPVHVAADKGIGIVAVERDQHLVQRHRFGALYGFAGNPIQRIAALDGIAAARRRVGTRCGYRRAPGLSCRAHGRCRTGGFAGGRGFLCGRLRRCASRGLRRGGG
ncbi:hypothetical protein D9M69_450720 [compost metagenome]